MKRTVLVPRLTVDVLASSPLLIHSHSMDGLTLLPVPLPSPGPPVLHSQVSPFFSAPLSGFTWAVLYRTCNLPNIRVCIPATLVLVD